jgi:hypothetical protein
VLSGEALDTASRQEASITAHTISDILRRLGLLHLIACISSYSALRGCGIPEAGTLTHT